MIAAHHQIAVRVAFTAALLVLLLPRAAHAQTLPYATYQPITAPAALPAQATAPVVPPTQPVYYEAAPNTGQAVATPPTPGPVEVAKTGEDDKAIFSFVLENDIFAGTDNGYTNGFRASMVSSESATPDSIRWAADHLLPLSLEGNKRIDFAIGQNIYTPTDTAARVPDPKDRPYAGWLYGSVGVISDRGDRLDNVMLSVGVVGPSSLAEQTQDTVHGLIGDAKPRGWDYQLKDEPGVMLTLERTWRSLYAVNPTGLAFDVSPYIGSNLGNVETDASAGATLRLGWDLPADYGPPRIRPSLPGSDFFIPTETLGGYLFLGAEGRGVAQNIFLDGNTFTDSPSVDKKLLVGNLQGGFAITYKDTRLSYTHVLETKEFATQQKAEQFGAVTLSYRF